MLQDIIVFIIIGGAAAYTVFAGIRNLGKKEKSGCDGCSGCDIKREITQHKSSSAISYGCDNKSIKK